MSAQQIEKNKAVGISYTLTDGEGQIVDVAPEDDPMWYLHGEGQLLPAVESGLDGKVVGDGVKLDLTAAEAYGEHNSGKVQTVPRASFPEDLELEVGMPFMIQTEEGQINDPFFVKAFDDDEVTLDGNHPLAGRALKFDIKVCGIRDANPDELAHGHVHGPGGHHHH